MIIAIGFLALLMLCAGAVIARRQGRSGVQIALLVVAGIIGIPMALFAVLLWGFSGFG